MKWEEYHQVKDFLSSPAHMNNFTYDGLPQAAFHLPADRNTTTYLDLLLIENAADHKPNFPEQNHLILIPRNHLSAMFPPPEGLKVRQSLE